MIQIQKFRQIENEYQDEPAITKLERSVNGFLATFSGKVIDVISSEHSFYYDSMLGTMHTIVLVLDVDTAFDYPPLLADESVPSWDDKRAETDDEPEDTGDNPF